MAGLHFKGKITTVSADDSAAIVTLSADVAGVVYAVLDHKDVGNDFVFRRGLVVEGVGQVVGEAIEAVSASISKEALEFDPVEQRLVSDQKSPERLIQDVVIRRGLIDKQQMFSFAKKLDRAKIEKAARVILERARRPKMRRKTPSQPIHAKDRA